MNRPRRAPNENPKEPAGGIFDRILFGHTCVGNSLSIPKRPKMGRLRSHFRHFCHTCPGICRIGPDFPAPDGCPGDPK